jgi:biopolymer transport protein ExbB
MPHTALPSRPAHPARRRALALARWVGMLSVLCLLLMVSAHAMAQGSSPAPTGAPPAAPAAASTPAAATPAAAPGAKVTLFQLFGQSFDLFTVLLVIGSLAGWTIIIVCVIEIRAVNIAPEQPPQDIANLARAGRFPELRQYVAEDDALVSRVVRAAMAVPVSDKNAVREAAELAASEESARWFRKLEPLNVIGNLGPLLGLAGTVWGMIIAFAALSEAGGQANPQTLSLGISKALFHTLLGLMLAVPCLAVFGFYRQLVDRLCTRAMVQAADLVELLPADARVRLDGAAPRPAPGATPRAPVAR